MKKNQTRFLVTAIFTAVNLLIVNVIMAADIPEVFILKTNTKTVRQYEKFEITIGLKNITIENPYDPDEIDVYAEIKTPGGSVIRVNGFYDNYKNANSWKLRFSPNMKGVWSFRVFAKNKGATGTSEQSTFICIESEHHGWIVPSKKNHHYFAYDDGTSYYAVAAYSPYGNNQKIFDTYAEHKANLLALWDISYGGFVNGTGLIEEELGKYNQVKCARIDSLLEILENDNIELMFAIWPHDLFSKTVWYHQWDNNPLSKVTNVVNVYSDSVAWNYQKRKYRYLIARFAHSRSFGIWELINEMNGTDGWQEGHQQEAYDWVEKVHKYFAENDPYKHPVTASFSGGYNEYRPPLYERTDIANLHLYEAQGWHLKYPGDTLRSSMYNYAWASQRFWNNFDKPAIFGEAGANLTYMKPRRPEYHDHYHNAIWASLSNGLAGTPVWWTQRELSERDWNHLEYLSGFVSDIDFANKGYKPTQITADDADAYGMLSRDDGFGWIRTYSDKDVSGETITLKVADGKYEVKWFDTWTGKYLKTARDSSYHGIMKLTVPKLPEAHMDAAFRIQQQ